MKKEIRIFVVGLKNVMEDGIKEFMKDMERIVFGYYGDFEVVLVSLKEVGSSNLSLYANARRVPLFEVCYDPPYSRYYEQKRKEGIIGIIEQCDVVIAFYDGENERTRFAIDEANKRSKHVYVYPMTTKENQYGENDSRNIQ